MRGAPLSCLKFRSIFSLGPKPISRSQRDAASWTRMAPLSLTWRTCLWTHSNIRPIRSQTRVWYQKHGQIPIFVPTEHILDPRILESMSIHTNTDSEETQTNRFPFPTPWTEQTNPTRRSTTARRFRMSVDKLLDVAVTPASAT
jgi:hypothetical protein